MSYTMEVLPDENIVWEVWGADFNPETDGVESTEREIALLSASSSPMVLVVDLRHIPLTFDDILFLATHGLPAELTAHPHLRRMILISTSDVIEASAQGLDTEAFGFVKLDVVASSEDALERARELLAPLSQ